MPGMFRVFLVTGRRISLQSRLRGGGRGIRTPGTVSRTAVFKTACFNHSHIPPQSRDEATWLTIVYNSWASSPERLSCAGVGCARVANGVRCELTRALYLSAFAGLGSLVR